VISGYFVATASRCRFSSLSEGGADTLTSYIKLSMPNTVNRENTLRLVEAYVILPLKTDATVPCSENWTVNYLVSTPKAEYYREGNESARSPLITIKLDSVFDSLTDE
jgi:hypothetical protein